MGEEELERRRRRDKRRRVGLRYMPITPILKIIPKDLEILILGSNHPTELVMLFLNKVTEVSMLSLDINV